MLCELLLRWMMNFDKNFVSANELYPKEISGNVTTVQICDLWTVFYILGSAIAYLNTCTIDVAPYDITVMLCVYKCGYCTSQANIFVFILLLYMLKFVVFINISLSITIDLV